MRRLAKTTIAAALSWSGVHGLLGRRHPATPLILGYHRVVESVAAVQGKILPGMTISQRMLRAHLEWVARRYSIVSLEELGAALERQEPCGRLAAITFDDGYQDVHDHALPVLQQMGLPAAVFVVSSLVGTNHLPLHDELFEIVKDVSGPKARRSMPRSLADALRACDHDPLGGPLAMIETVRALLDLPTAKLNLILDDLRAHGWHNVPARELVTMDWAALEAMQRGGVTIGSHTHTHAMLDREDDDRLRDELARSRAVLEAGLGRPVHHFAYPDGRFNLRVARAVEAAGYKYAYTICDHSVQAAPLMTIPRVMLWEGSCAGALGGFSSSLMRCHASSVLPFPSRCDDDHRAQVQVLPC
jgi:peptidoglycan/xylan/chitin deacetylase (PgdA/CDA1 family)